MKLSKLVFFILLALLSSMQYNFVFSQVSAPEKQPLPSETANNFEPAWQNYLAVFNPIRDAFYNNNYESVREFLPHLKEAAVALKKTRLPNTWGPEAKNAFKAMLKQTKAFLKAARSGDRSQVRDNFDRLKNLVDQVENLRARHQ
jgi:hypothetical protein